MSVRSAPVIAEIVQTLSSFAFAAVLTVSGGNAALRNQHRALASGHTVGQYFVY